VLLPSSPILSSRRSRFSFATLGGFFEVLVLLDICQDAGFFAGLVKSAQSLLESLVIPNYHVGHLISNPLSFS
jgi:hypothetical protein